MDKIPQHKKYKINCKIESVEISESYVFLIIRVQCYKKRFCFFYKKRLDYNKPAVCPVYNLAKPASVVTQRYSPYNKNNKPDIFL